MAPNNLDTCLDRTRDIHLDDLNGEDDSAQALLDDENGTSRARDAKRQEYDLTQMGKLRAYWLGLVVSFGGYLFGYDSGIIGGVLTLKSFARDYGFSLPNTQVASLSVGLQQLGALVACFAIWPITHRYGRKWPLVWCLAVFIVGAAIQTANTQQLHIFYAGRLISGLGLGGGSVIVPMFSSEMSPKNIRGTTGSFYQWMFTLGIFSSYWIDWAVSQHISSDISRQWQIPVGLQCLLAFALLIGTIFLKESTRWLTQKGFHEAAWRSLVWVRADDGKDVELEMEEIRSGVEFEKVAKHGFKISEMFKPPHSKRTVLAATVFIAQQSTGATAFAYFGPQYFQLLVGDSGNISLFLTAVFGGVKVVSCTLFVFCVADTVGRRVILTVGALVMATCQLSTALIVSTNPVAEAVSSRDLSKNTDHLSSAALGTVALIYLFVAAYNLSWGPLPWPYVSEIFPMRAREPGIALGVACQWLGNFLFSFTTPYMIESLGWGTFVVWGTFDLIIAAFAWAMLVETKGQSLEEIARGAVGDIRDDDDDTKDD